MSGYFFNVLHKSPLNGFVFAGPIVAVVRKTQQQSSLLFKLGGETAGRTHLSCQWRVW